MKKYFFRLFFTAFISVICFAQQFDIGYYSIDFGYIKSTEPFSLNIDKQKSYNVALVTSTGSNRSLVLIDRETREMYIGSGVLYNRKPTFVGGIATFRQIQDFANVEVIGIANFYIRIIANENSAYYQGYLSVLDEKTALVDSYIKSLRLSDEKPFK